MSDQVKPLPAFVRTDDAVDYWPELPAMTYAEANAVGRDRAADLLETMRRTDAPNILGYVYEAMNRRGEFGGAEIGFFHVLSIELMQSPIHEFVEVPADRPPSSRKMGCLRIVA